MDITDFSPKSSTLAISALLLLALGSWWLRLGIEDRVERRANPPHTADYWVERLSARTMDNAGHPRRMVTAAAMRHFPDDESTELTAPQIHLLGPRQPPWQIRAETGWVSPNGELVLLQGAVVIDRAAALEVLPVHLETRDVRVQPKQEYAETEQPVAVVNGPHQVHSRGMRAWLKEPVRIKLLADVHGHYEVSP
jgi:lipopolysaccharide export system protein LptC